MKTLKLSILLTFLFAVSGLFAQRSDNSENHGNALNLGIGVGGYSGYYHYVGRTLPVIGANYEISVAPNLTIAPFVTFYTYRNEDKHYRESIIPLGLKGTFYLDRLINANSDWDFYLAGSAGFAIIRSYWDDGYSGNTYYHNVSPLFLDVHAGTEYHLSKDVGFFLDISSGVSTLGIAFH